jgi:cell division protein FtsN
VFVERRGALLAPTKPAAEPVVSASPLPTLGSGERTDDNSGPSTLERVLAALIPIVLILGMAIAAIILSRRGAFDRPREPVAVAPSSVPSPQRPSQEATPSPPAEPDASTTPPVVDSPVMDSPVVDTPVVNTPVANTPVVDTPVVAPPPAPPAVNPAARFCLAVGTYLFEERAVEKAKALTRSSGLRAWVDVAVGTDSRGYRVLLGGFPTEADAERAADRLLSKGLVSEALVENLPASGRGRR